MSIGPDKCGTVDHFSFRLRKRQLKLYSKYAFNERKRSAR